MTGILVFDLVAVPDIAGLRHVYELDPALTDHEVAEYAQQKQRAVSGDDTLPSHLRRIVEISCVWLGDGTAELISLAEADGSEGRLVQRFFDLVNARQPLLVAWDALAGALPVLRYRALLARARFPVFHDLASIARRVGFAERELASGALLPCVDLGQMMAGGNDASRSTLDHLLKLTVSSDSAVVPDLALQLAWAGGDLAKIRVTNERRAVGAFALFLRLQHARGLMSESALASGEDLVRTIFPDDNCYARSQS
ncbi:3'-5' exonuclease [Niveibacterium umoris]|uniref:Putative PolB exonuclease-like 3'-5' exonuclease n=1 Tax=Niveibacterium umoris TaxID=1193620 RepID=A0A840BFM3_9RHOO|nr:hypothetical protein [Niveibacterium umoris]MBB4011985.1 putative PolB exonuclease-like 3'-5' exonuclease [Niveibacterium umoris]